MPRYGRLFLGLAGIAVFTGLSCLKAEDTLHTAENSHFEIVAVDPRSPRYLDELSRHVVEINARYLHPERLDFPRRILVNLKPESYVDFEGYYEIRLAEGGFVTLNLRWTEDLELMLCCRALTEALLVRYAHYNHGPESWGDLPEWTVSALGTAAYLSLRPSQWPTVVQMTHGDEIPELADLLARKWDGETHSLDGFWLLQSLERRDSGRMLSRRAVQAAIADADVAILLEAFIQPGAADAEAQSLRQWWVQSRNELLNSDFTAFERLHVSRAWIEKLSAFEWEGEAINLRQLWTLRKEPDVKQMIEARYEILRLRLARVNPAYFNAARSLGALLETLLEGEKVYEYIGNLGKFLGDFEDTKEIEAIVNEKLGAPRTAP